MTTKPRKKCSKCERRREHVHFNKDKSMKDGLRSSCRECESLAKKKWREQKNAKVAQARGVENQVRTIKAEANRNALLSLMRRHPAEFEQLVEMEMRRIKARMGDPEAEKLWISLA